MRKLKYLDNETIYKDDAYLALHERFDSQQQFEDYYSRLKFPSPFVIDHESAH